MKNNVNLVNFPEKYVENTLMTLMALPSAHTSIKHHFFIIFEARFRFLVKFYDDLVPVWRTLHRYLDSKQVLNNL